jgi:hypothetical protein
MNKEKTPRRKRALRSAMEAGCASWTQSGVHGSIHGLRIQQPVLIRSLLRTLLPMWPVRNRLIPKLSVETAIAGR